jgi:hypothetical protein
MLADLVLRSNYPQPPSDELALRFRAHVRETGMPETFPGISTTKPPSDGEVIPLALKITIPGKRRAWGKMAPCPICSSRTPKWIENGTLIWCEATEAIYCIGPKCYGTLWSDGRLDREINRRQRTLREEENLAALSEAIEMAPAQLAWIKDHFKPAKRATLLHESLASSAPKFRGAVARGIKGSLVMGNQIGGHGFIRGRWALDEKLRQAEAVWLRLVAKPFSDAYPGVADELAPRAVQERLVEVRASQGMMAQVAQSLADAAAFLSRASIQNLAKWGKAANAPIEFSAAHTATGVRITCGQESWEGPIGLAPPAPIPGGEDV